jgi:Flp pilus assembly pilin Flp
VTRALREETAQGLSEYALILVFVAIAAVTALTFLGGDIASFLSSVATAI